MRAFRFADSVSVMTVGVGTAFAVVFMLAMLFVYPVVNQICEYTGYNGNHKQHSKNHQSLIRDHCKHDKGLIA